MSEAKSATAETVAAKPLKMYKLTIHSGQDVGSKSDVFLALNYEGIQIQRDKEVIISEDLLGVLKGTVIETTVKGEDRIVRNIKIPTYSYSSQAI